jgi:hypothetical protein
MAKPKSKTTFVQETLLSVTIDRRGIERALEEAARQALVEEETDPGALDSISFFGSDDEPSDLQKVIVTFKERSEW